MKVDSDMACMLMLVSMSLTLMQSHRVSAEQKIKSLSISTTKQAISIKLATSTTLGDNKFYFSAKSSVAFILNYGHMNISCKTRTVWSVPAFWACIRWRDKRFHGCNKTLQFPLSLSLTFCHGYVCRPLKLFCLFLLCMCVYIYKYDVD